MPVLLVIFLLAILITLAMLFAAVVLARSVGRRLSNTLNLSSLPRSVTQSLKESRRYARLIVETAEQYPAGPIQDRLNRTLQPVEQWLASLDRLEVGLAQLYRQRNLSRDLRQTDREVDELRRKLLAANGDEAVFLRDLIKSKKQHLIVLKELQLFQTQAELKIHKIASDLGATHAEMLLVAARGDFNENRFRRLDENLQEHLGSMRDMLGAMEELGYHSATS